MKSEKSSSGETCTLDESSERKLLIGNRGCGVRLPSGMIHWFPSIREATASGYWTGKETVMTYGVSTQDFEKIEKAFNEAGLPEYMLHGLKYYLQDGVIPGHFLKSVLENNLIGATSHADSSNYEKIGEWAKFAYNHLPGNCWGSKLAVSRWIDARKAESDSYGRLQGGVG